MSEDETAIRGVVEAWMSASKSGDLDTVLGLMTEDVVFSVCGQAPFGKKEFAATSQAMRGVKIEGESVIEELQVLGAWAFIRSKLDLSITPPNGAPMRRAGHTLTLLRKEADGKWRLARDANMVTAVS